ncbi:MAG: hypothetical protein RL154_482 [Pseudomonadota bacterium]|jgi:methyl-accepting chemotaxis protein
MALVRSGGSNYGVTVSSSRGDNGLQASLEKRKQRTLAKQQQISEQIASIAMRLLENAQEAVSAAEELKSSMDQIATAAEENSGASEQGLKSVNEIGKNITRMTNTIESAISSTLSAGESITGSVGMINNTVERMVSSVRIAKESSEKSEELKVSSQNIGEAVGFIAKIADQTNLLALNAAIEASRAKEHGKGFAVVADETRALAGNSEKNAKFIADLVTQIQSGIDNIIKSITSTTEIIEKTGVSGRRLSDTLEELVKITNYSVEAARNASTFTSQLLTLSTEVKHGSESIAQASFQIASAVEETLHSIDIQANALSQVEDDIKELTKLSEDLKFSTDTAKSTEEIAVSADALGSSVEEVRKSMGEVTKALNDIESSSKTTNDSALQNRENIEKAASVSKDIDSIVEIVRRNFDILKASFSKIKNTLVGVKLDFENSIKEGTGAREDLAVIKKESRNVEKTVGNISNSIIQLNMLAISGSIEAARAGDFGKGFAVVSTDIRSLAQDSQTNTEKINDIIELMNAEIDNVNTDWNNLLKSQDREQGIIDNLISEVDNITGQLVDILDRYQGLKTINDQNVEGLTHALGGIQEIQKAIELSATNAMESRKASELIIETIETMAEGIEDLAALADELQQGA